MNYYIVGVNKYDDEFVTEYDNEFIVFQTTDKEYAYRVFNDLEIPEWHLELRETEDDINKGDYVDYEVLRSKILRIY